MVAPGVSERILVHFLVTNFERCLAEFESRNPFSGEQFRLHEKTASLRARHRSATTLLEDDEFLNSLHDTLDAWLGRRGALLRERPGFRNAMRACRTRIAELDQHSIDSFSTELSGSLWSLVRRLDITGNESKLVAASKALHHVLPNLVVPIDRTYTAPFLLRCQPHHFQKLSGEEKTFELAFKVFSIVAAAANPGQYVKRGSKWNTSATKVIDNAIVGLMRWQMALE